MKAFFSTILLSALFFLPFATDAYVSVKGYYKKDGTYVAPHVRSNPNGLKYDNYGWTPSRGLYNATYGTKGSYWDTPTYITDPHYYEGKSLYENGLTSGNTYSASSKLSTPANATTYGSTWFCNSGYKTLYDNSYNKIGCTKIVSPANAYVYGSDWYCNSGYKTQYDASFDKVGCQKVVAPANAYIYGSDWYCNSGYKTIYDSAYNKSWCEKVIAPANAYVYGSDWYCNTGYKTQYDSKFSKIGCISQ